MVASVRVGPRLRSAAFNGVKVFCATKFADRQSLGDTVTRWLAEHREFDIADIVVTQSSDSAFHCLTVSVFYFDRMARTGKAT